MAEWSKAAVLKTAVGASPPGVRIPPHPLVGAGAPRASLQKLGAYTKQGLCLRPDLPPDTLGLRKGSPSHLLRSALQMIACRGRVAANPALWGRICGAPRSLAAPASIERLKDRFGVDALTEVSKREASSMIEQLLEEAEAK